VSAGGRPRRPRARTGPPPASPEGHSWRQDLVVLLGAFAAGSAIAGALGAANLGTALSFGQIAFGLALVFVIVRR